MKGAIDRSASKGDNEDNADSWDEHKFDMEGKEESEWETIARERRGGEKRGGGVTVKNAKEDEAKKGENLSSHTKRIKRLNTQNEQIKKEMLSEKPLVDEGRGGWERSSLRFLTLIHTRIQMGV